MNRSAGDLHYEHKNWLSELQLVEDGLVSLIKVCKRDDIKRDIGTLVRQCVDLKHIIHKHENRIALAFKACAINDYDQFFEDHEKVRHMIEVLKFKLDDFRLLVSGMRHAGNEMERSEGESGMDKNGFFKKDSIVGLFIILAVVLFVLLLYFLGNPKEIYGIHIG